MIQEYIEAALAKARYEIIKDETPYYGEIPGLKGVWASGKTLEECRRNLVEVVENWIIVRKTSLYDKRRPCSNHSQSSSPRNRS